MLTSKQRAALRGYANGLVPAFQVGKGGVDEELIKGAQACLAKREIVKIRTLETSPQQAREAAQLLAEATGSDVVQVIGRVLVLFRKKKKESAFEDLLRK